jgi:hypothetical protein
MIILPFLKISELAIQHSMVFFIGSISYYQIDQGQLDLSIFLKHD